LSCTLLRNQAFFELDKVAGTADDSPNMSGTIRRVGLPPDDQSHEGQGPQFGQEPVLASTAAQPPIELLELRGSEAMLAPDATGGTQTRDAGSFPFALRIPAADSLPVDLQSARGGGMKP
jgi:hypothetical protein